MGRLLRIVMSGLLFGAPSGIVYGCRDAKLSDGGIPVFEVREVGCHEQTNDSAWTYDCQGTLLTRDGRYQSGDLVVWYQNVSKHASGKEMSANPSPYFVLMSNGVATLTSGAYYSRKHKVGNFTIGDYDTDPGAPQPAWKILGFSRVEPVRAETQK